MRRILISAVLVGLIFFQTSYSLKFVAYGDSRSYATIHEDVVHRFAEDNPELVLHVGDLWDDIGESAWKYAFTSNTVANALLYNNKVLVSRGNHESQGEVLQFTPSIILNDEFLYSFKESNCFFVSMEYEPASNNTWLETQLQSTESQSADWRFIWAHKPIYSSGAGHPSDGSSYLNFRKLCDKYHVTMFFSGHDHHYERSYLIYNNEAVNQRTDIEFEDSLNGTFYFVTGGGGAPVYGLGSAKWWGDGSIRTTDNHYCFINTDTPDLLEFVAKDKDGNVLDQVTITKAASPYTTLSAPDGGELWEQNSTHIVTWEDNLDEKVKIELYKGGSLNLTISDSTESDGEYEWEIPVDQETGNDYKVKITSVSNAVVFSESSENFSIEHANAISFSNNMMNSSVTLKIFGSSIYYEIPDNGYKNQRVSIKLYDLKGKLIGTLIDGVVGCGAHFIDLKSLANKDQLAKGVYLCSVKSKGFNKTITFMVNK